MRRPTPKKVYMKKVVLVFVLMLATAVALNAQHRLKRKADAHYSKLSYELAIPYYEHFLKRHKDDDATMKLADCYLLTHDYKNAAKWYDKVLAVPSHPAITYFYYGHALLQNKDFDNAEEMFRQYSKLVPADQRGKNFINAIQRYESLTKDSMRVQISHLPFNTAFTEFGTFPYKNGIIFASSKEVGIPVRQSFNWLDSPFLNFFFTSYKKDSAKWTHPELLKGEVNTRFHESNFTMADGATEFIFTRNNYFEKEREKATKASSSSNSTKAKSRTWRRAAWRNWDSIPRNTVPPTRAFRPMGRRSTSCLTCPAG